MPDRQLILQAVISWEIKPGLDGNNLAQAVMFLKELSQFLEDCDKKYPDIKIVASMPK